MVTAGAGVVADLSGEFSPTASAAPTSSTAAAVTRTAAAGSRRHRANNRLRRAAGAAIRVVGASTSPAGMTRDWWAVADQARIGIGVGPAGGTGVVAVRSGLAARAVAVAGAAGTADAADVASPAPRATRSAAPTAAVSWGRGVVATGTRRCRASVVVMAGRFAPPPTTPPR